MRFKRQDNLNIMGNTNNEDANDRSYIIQYNIQNYGSNKAIQGRNMDEIRIKGGNINIT